VLFIPGVLMPSLLLWTGRCSVKAFLTVHKPGYELFFMGLHIFAFKLAYTMITVNVTNVRCRGCYHVRCTTKTSLGSL